MTKCKKRGKYGKGLFVGVKESEDYEEEEIAEFAEELVFYSSGSAQFVEEKGDSGPMLIVNLTFFTFKGKTKISGYDKIFFKLFAQLG